MSDNIPATSSQSLPAEASSQNNGITLNSLSDQISNSTLVPLVVGGAIIITALLALFMWASTPTYKPIYTNVSEIDGGAIIAELEQRGVDYKVDGAANSILVPSDEVHKLRLQLAEKGLPQGGDNGFEIIDEQKFGISQFAEQVNFQRALEGELSRSITTLGPIAKARIHLALAKPSVFARQQEASKASVILTLHPGRTLTKGQASAIAHLVSSSITELQSSDVSIVDQQGNLLGVEDTEDGELSLNRLEYVQTVEEKIQRRVERILLPIFGPNNFRVQIAAEVDFTAQEETAEQFKPNQGQEAGVTVRSAQTRATANDTDADIGGFAGALSNSPPGWMQSPIDNGPDGNGNSASDAVGSAGDLDFANTVNYEVDRSIIHTKRQPGQVIRLTAAVVVNHRDAFTEEGELIKEAIPQGELDQIEALIRQSIGFDEVRGDQLQLVNTLFAEKADSADQGPMEWWQSADVIELIDSIARYFFAFIGSLFMYFILLRPLIKRHREAKKAARDKDTYTVTTDAEGNKVAQLPDGSTVPANQMLEGEQNDYANEIAFDAQGNFQVSTVSNEYAKSYETALTEAKNLADNDPQVVALAIKEWMSQK